MKFVVYVNREKYPSFEIEAESWPGVMEALAADLPRRDRSHIGGFAVAPSIRIDSDDGGGTELLSLTIQWLHRQEPK